VPRQGLGQTGKSPCPEHLARLDTEQAIPPGTVGHDRQLTGRGLEFLGGKRRALPLAQGLEKRFQSGLVEQLDGNGFLPAIGLDQGISVSHRAHSLAPPTIEVRAEFDALAISHSRPYSMAMTEYVIADDTDIQPRDGTIKLHGPAAFEGMRKAGRLAAEILDALAPLAVPGAVTADLDAVVRDMTLAAGAVPATLGYRGYTHSCCISINHVVCHGIPSERTLKDGDIVNIDVTPARRLARGFEPHVPGRRRAAQGQAAGRRHL
jgi:hypothetical protein